jgi:hypothetical protein
MTAGEPGGDFRARVVSRIGARSGASSRMWRLSSTGVWRPAFAGLAIAVFVVAAVVIQHQVRSRSGGAVQEVRVRLKPDATAAPADRLKPDATAAPADRLKPNATAMAPAQVGLKPDATAPAQLELNRERVEVRLKPDTTRERAAVGLVPDATDLAPLALAPLNVDTIAVQQLPAEDSIRIAQLPPVAPIAVAPLGVDDQGDRR